MVIVIGLLQNDYSFSFIDSNISQIGFQKSFLRQNAFISYKFKERRAPAFIDYCRGMF